MKKIIFSDPHRQKHFAFFSGMDNPHFGITANVDITSFLQVVRRSPELRFTPAIVYLISRAAFEVEPFRWRIRNGAVMEHDTLQPSFAVPTRQSSAFSFCTVRWQSDPLPFHRAAVEQMEKMAEEPSFTDEVGQDNYLFLSAFPWASFTSVTHAMDTRRGDSVPRITWGKYFKQNGHVFMPLAVQAHHALVDGSDLGKYYQRIEQLLRKSAQIFSCFEKK